MRSINSIVKSFLFGVLFSMLMITIAGAAEPSYGTANVDGSYAEWNLADDFFADMYLAFKPTNPVLSKLYLRYDCQSGTMYALVLTTPDTLPAAVSAGDAWIAIDTIASKVVTGSSGDDGTPPDFAWVGQGFDGDPAHARGYEASFSIAEGSYAIIAHVDVISGGTQTSGTVKTGVALTIDCPVLGACCFPDGTCSEVTAADCAAQGGAYQGDGTDCDPNPCPQPTGACCLPDGTCSEVTSAECAAQGGAYQGDGTDCDPNPCPQPSGACCFPDGTCSEVTAAECAAQGGAYQGDGTDCDPNPCPQPSGACCLPDGTCSEVTAAECAAQGGAYQGDGTDCDPNPCPQPSGACCFPDGTCSEVTAAECAAQGGAYQGDGTDCDPNPCPQPTGACCFPDGTCSEGTEAECTAQGGTYQGDGTDCDPNPCEAVVAFCEYCVIGIEGVYADPKLWIDGSIVSNGEIVILGGGNLVDVSGGGEASYGVNQVVSGDLIHNGAISIGGGSDINGNVDSGASIVIGTTVQIQGNVTAAGSITLGGDSVIYGTMTEFGTPLAYTPIPCPPETNFAAGGLPVIKPNGKTTTLPPGSYGALELGTLNKLYLSSGDYYFTRIKILNSLKLYLDLTGGPINIYVEGDVYFGTNMDVYPTGGAGADVYLETHGAFQMLGGSDWYGTVFAPFGNIVISGGNNNIFGRLWSCKNVILDDCITIHCVPCP